MPLNHIKAQEQSSRLSRQSSLDAFSKEDYELAYRGFSELLDIYPQDPIYRYYCGVCLVKMEKDPTEAAVLLKEAMKSSSIVKTIPADALFWLGRAQQLAGQYEDALASYNSFTDINGRKESRQLGIPGFIQQCERREGHLTADTGDEVTEMAEETDEYAEAEEDADTIFTSVSDALPGDYDAMLTEAFNYQHIADSLYRLAEENRLNLGSGTYSERTILKSKTDEMVRLADHYQDLADQKYDEAQKAMNSEPFTGEHITARIDTPAPDTDDEAEVPVSPSPSPVTEITSDSITTVGDTLKTEFSDKADLKEQTVEETDTLGMKKKEQVQEDTSEPAEKIEIYYRFEIREEAANDDIPLDPELPDGLLYRIQVAVFRNPVSSSYFKGLAPVYGFRMQGRDLTIYYAGMFRSMSDAGKALATVRQKGFKDAFISAFFNGKAVSQERAAALEKQWRKVPLAVEEKEVKTPVDTIPPTLSLRIEIARSEELLEKEEVDDFIRVSGSRGFEIITLPEGDNVYLIGTFITWESAEEYADLLIRNGYTEAKISAWLGKREIPVEIARELFERIE